MKKRGKKINFILLVTVGAILLSLVLLFSILSGKVTDSDVNQCTDTDNGKNFFVKGIVTNNGTSPGGSYFEANGTDFCSTNKKLNEYFCDENSYINHELYECPVSCRGGVCSEISCSTLGGSCLLNTDCCDNLVCINDQCQAFPICTDTDGDKNYSYDYYSKGTATSTASSKLPSNQEEFTAGTTRELSTFTDFCLNPFYLYEYTCGNDGFIHGTLANCQYACENGVCASSCRSIGQSCATFSSCCQGLYCELKDGFNGQSCKAYPSCRNSQESCTYTLDCCSNLGLICSSGLCLTPRNNQTSCKSAPATCYSDSECCSELNCVQNKCKFPSSNQTYSQQNITPSSQNQTNQTISRGISQKEIIQNENFTEPTPAIEGTCESGCLFRENCLPYGYRVGTRYCSITNDLVNQSSSGSCNNNFECTSNSCIDGQCIEPGLWTKIINWFLKFFGQ